MSVHKKSFFMKKALPSLVAGLLLPGLAYAFSPFVVKDVQIRGLENAEPATIFAYIPARVGQKFTDAGASETLRRLYSTGLFDDVSVSTQNSVVLVTVKERPTISTVTFDGMTTIDSKQITTALTGAGFGQGRSLDPALLEKAKNEIRQQYIDKGRYGVKIDSTLTPLPSNRVGVNFKVFEGTIAKIEDIHFVGNKAFSQGTLSDEMQLTTNGFMTWYTGSDKYARDKLNQDVDSVRDFYLNHGYLDVNIDPPQVSISPDRQSVNINVTVKEGQPYKLKSVKVAGELLGLDSEIQSLVIPKAGEIFNVDETRQTVEAIKAYLGGLGYAFANVNPSPAPDAKTGLADLTFYVDPGKRVYVRRINIGGNVRTRDEVIRREMRQQEAAWYDANLLSTSQARVNRLGYFKDVQITRSNVKGSNDQVDVNVDVKENPTGLINLGVGYGTTDRLTFQAGISQDNIFGSGTDLAFQLNTSSNNRTASITHTDPYFTDNGISRSTSLYYTRSTPFNSYVSRSEDSYISTTKGIGMNFGIPISESDRVFFGTTFENNRIQLPVTDSQYAKYTPIAYEEFVKNYGASSNVIMFNLGWSKDTRDSALAPTKGYMTSLNGTVGVGDLKYYMLNSQYQQYVPLGRDFTLAFNAAADYGRSLSNKPYPVIKNVYAGGIGSLRGYDGSSLGARDERSGDYLGGNSRLVGNVQLFLPFPGTQKDNTLRWFVFADAGKVNSTVGSLTQNGTCGKGSADYGTVVTDPCGWRYSTGVGLSWYSPLGPLQISYAKPIGNKPGDNLQQFQFQIGTSF